MIDPAGEDQNKLLPKLQDEFHTTPDGVGSKDNSIPDQRVAVNQPKQNSRELLQESSFQPHAGRLSFFTLRPNCVRENLNVTNSNQLQPK